METYERMKYGRLGERLGRLREILDEESYELCCGLGDVVYRLTSAKGREVLEQAWLSGQRLSDRQKSLLLLFFFGSEVSKPAIESVLSLPVCSTLVELGLLLDLDTTFRTNGCSIVPFRGSYLFAPQFLCSSPRSPLYLGADSLSLVEAVRRCRSAETTFEVGAGTGIVGLAGAQGSYAASEIDPWCALVAQTNFALNDQAGRCTVTLGDLYEGCPPIGVDLVVSNPPYVPEPPELNLPVFAGGGEDGLRVVRRILEDAPLESSCVLALRAYGNAQETILEEALQTLVPRRSAQVWYLNRSRLRDADFTALALGTSPGTSVPTDAALFAEHYHRQGFTHQFDAVVNTRFGGRPGLSVVHAHDDWDDDSIPTSTGFQPSDKSSDERAILKAVDGRRNVAEIVAFLHSEGDGPERTIEEVLTICRRASLAGFLRLVQ